MNRDISLNKPVKICDNWECPVKFKCSTVVVNIMKTTEQIPSVE